MNENKIVDEKVVTTATEVPVETPKETTEDKSQDPIKNELERVKNKTSGRTELEKALFTKQQIEKRIKELGGTDEVIEEDDSAPVTVGTLRKIEKQRAQDTALTKADTEISDADERELTKYHIQNTIRPTGNPDEDLRLARAIVNSVKNTQIIEEIKRKTPAKTVSSGNGAPAKVEEVFEPTKDELAFMSAPFNLSKEQIIEARKRTQK